MLLRNKALYADVSKNVFSLSRPSVISSMDMGDYYTKSTPIFHLHFTRKNVLLSFGAYGQ